MTGCWRGSRPCFMLSVLAYLALPIPCDAYLICVPPQVGDSWTYRRETVDRLSQRAETEIDTVTVSVVGTEQIGDQEYYRLSNGELYRTSADGVIWRYYGEGEVVYSDLWRVGAYQEGEIWYEGVLLGQPTEHPIYKSEFAQIKLVRWGPLGIVVGDSLYSGVFAFEIKEPCCTEYYLTLYVHPEIGALKMTLDTMEYYYVVELISFSHQSGESDVPSAVREVTWGTVKKRHMSEGLR